MRGIERQSDYYAHADEGLAQRSAARESAAELPTEDEVRAMLSGPSIPQGMMDHRAGD